MKNYAVLHCAPSISNHQLLSADDLDELTFDGQVWTDRIRGKQLAGNAPVVRGVPLDALAVWGYKAR